MSQQAKKPEKEFRAGAISASVWRNSVNQGDQEVERFSVRIQKRFKAKDSEEWKNTDYYFPEDLPKLEAVVRKAYDYITVAERGDDDVDF